MAFRSTSRQSNSGNTPPERLKREQEKKEFKKKEKAEARLYAIIKVARDEDLSEQIGRDIYLDLVDQDKVKSFRFQKLLSFNLFKEEVAKEFGIPVQFQRFWLWSERQNHTCRPYRPLTALEEAQTVGQLIEGPPKVRKAELKLLLEVELGIDLQPIAPPEKTKDEILLFFKHYDPVKEKLRYLGRLFVKANGKPGEILGKLKEMAGNAAEDEIQLFEEIKFEPIVMCEQIDRNRTFRGNRLKDGDILCIQKAVSAEIAKTYRYANVTMFLEHMHNRPVTRRMSRLRKNSVAGDALKDLKTKGHSSKDAVQKAMNEPRGVHAIIADGDAILKKLNSVNNNQVVHFRRLEKPKEDDFSLELSRLDSYDDVVATVSIHIGLPDPSKIRLTPHNCFFNQPQIEPIKYRGVKNLAEMLVHCDKRSDILYYEVLDTPLPELATFAVDFVPARNDRVTRHTITLPENRDPEEAINDLKTEVELSHPDSGLSLYAVFHPNMDKIYPPYESVTLEAEEDPKEIQKEPRKSKKGA